MIFSKPSYQSDITQSSSKRCSPDISLNANPETAMFYLIGGKASVVGGTSTVAPALAAFTSILKINYFLNTKLYKLNAQAFHDITSGNNGGYNAGSGYDLCSGRGSLNGVKFIGFLSPVSTTGITLNPRNPNIKIGTVVQLTATVAPQNATNQLVNWSSSKPNIVSVSSSGLCTARSVGSSVITASQGNIRATTNVSVKLRLTTKNITIEKDKSCIVKLTSDSKDYLLTNNSESIVNCVCIDGSWKLTGKELGEANILIDYIDSDEAGILVVNVV
jgi:subtilase family serine protease